MVGKLFIFSAPSGSGKSTIVQHLMKLDLGLAFSISATSRSPREGEMNGREYHFITPEEFRSKIEKNEFIEWEEVYNNQYYGTLRSELEKIWNRGEHAVFDIDVVGGMNLKKEFKGHACSIFVQPPSLEVLSHRLQSRGTDDEASLKKRLGKAEYEMEFAPQFDHILVNDDIHQTLKKAETLIRNALAS